MRRRALVVLFVLSAVLATTGKPGIQKAEAHSGYWRVADTAGNGLRLRSGPGGDYPILLVMQRGDRLKAFGHRGNWIKVRHLASGTVGWAWLDFVVADAGSSAGGTGGGSGAICLTNYWREAICSSSDVGNAIRYWAGQYGIGWWWLGATAACESSFNVYAFNPISGVTGLFQFEPSTFWAWGGVDLYDPWDQSRIAAKMFAAGEARQYFCAILIGYA
jgi:hypothetical protein